MAKIKSLKFIFIGIFFLLILSGSVCPPDNPDSGESLSPDWLLRCSHCVATPTPPISVPTPEGTPEPSIEFMGARQCTIEEIESGCFETQYPVGAYKCYCWEAEPTPIGGGTPPPEPTPTVQTTNNFFSVPLGDFYLNSNTYNYVPVSNSFGGTNMCGQGNIFVGLYVNMVYTVTHLNDGYEQIILFANSTDQPFSTSTWQNKWNRYGTGTFNWERCYTSDYGNNDTVASLPGSSVNLHPCDELYGTSVPHINLLVNLYGGNPNYSNYFRWGGYRNYLFVDGYAEAMCYGIPIPEPTPSPTPLTGDDLYCSDYVYTNTDPVVIMPNISISNGTCFTIIPAFSIDTPAVGTIIPSMSISWESFKLCPVWATIGSMSIFDLQIPLELLFVPFVMWLLSMIIRL